MKLKELPIEVQEDVKSTLCVYEECSVWKHRANGSYLVMACTLIARNNPYEVVGRFNRDEVFTKEEQILNYINTFREYAPEYTGHRSKDYVEKLQVRELEIVDNKVKVTYPYRAVYEGNNIILINNPIIEYV